MIKCSIIDATGKLRHSEVSNLLKIMQQETEHSQSGFGIYARDHSNVLTLKKHNTKQNKNR